MLVEVWQSKNSPAAAAVYAPAEKEFFRSQWREIDDADWRYLVRFKNLAERTADGPGRPTRYEFAWSDLSEFLHDVS